MSSEVTRTGAILEMIAKHESGGDYNVMYGGEQAPLTKMTIGEVIAYQDYLAKQGADSTAAGKYQIIGKTMKDLSRRNPKDFGPERMFDAEAQEWAALTLMNRRGYGKFQKGEMSDEAFALELAKEWASLPDPSTGKSYYEKDGLNKSHHKTEDVLKTLNVLEGS